MCVFLGRAVKFFWPQSREAIAPSPLRGSAAVGGGGKSQNTSRKNVRETHALKLEPCRMIALYSVPNPKPRIRIYELCSSHRIRPVRPYTESADYIILAVLGVCC